MFLFIISFICLISLSSNTVPSFKLSKTSSNADLWFIASYISLGSLGLILKLLSLYKIAYVSAYVNVLPSIAFELYVLLVIKSSK